MMLIITIEILIMAKRRERIIINENRNTNNDKKKRNNNNKKNWIFLQVLSRMYWIEPQYPWLKSNTTHPGKKPSMKI